MNERSYLNNLYDNSINKIYIALSNDSRNMMKADEKADELRSYFYHLINFNPEEYMKNPILSNEVIMDLCSNIINASDCKNIVILFFIFIILLSN